MADNQEESQKIRILSRQLVQPSPPITTNKIVHLNSWDLPSLSADYLQHGLLLPKPPTNLPIDILQTSFSQALHHFYPFAGRLSTTHHHETSSVSIHIACNDLQGAEFVRASALNIFISDILSDFQVPAFVHSAFPIGGVVGHDGHSLPLLGAQVTELADGIFIAVSLNHVAGEGTCLWHFFSTWSKISRGLIGMNIEEGDCNVVVDRWFLDSCPRPVCMPFKGPAEFIKRVSIDPTTRSHCFFHLSSDTVKKFKAKANEEIAADADAEISSLQAVAAHLWRSITRARKHPPQTPAVHVIVVGYRAKKLLRLHPVPQYYTGNAFGVTVAITSTEELTNKGLGAAALLLNKQIAAYSEEEVYKEAENWGENPKICYLENDNGVMMYTAGSPRFDVFGCDFGWGRPVAMRTGGWNVAEGSVGVYRGAEEGSLELDVYLAKETMSALLKDEEFMKTVCLSPH